MTGIKPATVVARADPARLQRVRVRIHGIHASSVPDDKLPWALPSTRAWWAGGDAGAPPIGSEVWVLLIEGDHSSPVYLPGWWGTGETNFTVEGSRFTTARWPDSMFGSDVPWADGPLKLEPKAQPLNAPDNFTRRSPLGKVMAMDDRKDRQRVLVADQLDNGLFLNVEDGVLTTETWSSLREPSKKRFTGLTLSHREEFFQGYSMSWMMTLSDRQQVAEIAHVNGAVVRVGKDGRRVESWTSAGYRLVMDEDKARVELRTPFNRGLIIDDLRGRITLHSGSDPEDRTGQIMHWLHLDERNNRVELRSAGDLCLQAKGRMNLSSEGPLTLDGQEVHLNSGYANFSTSTAIPSDYLSSAFSFTRVMGRGRRAWEYPQYADAEKAS